MRWHVQTFVHVCNYITAASLGYSFEQVTQDAYIDLTEFWAYSYETKVTGSPMNSFDVETIINGFGLDVFSQFSYYNMAWFLSRAIY